LVLPLSSYKKLPQKSKMEILEPLLEVIARNEDSQHQFKVIIFRP
jgi:hypothetical protein